MSQILKIYKLKENAIIPSYGTKDSACFDISACIDNKTVSKLYYNSSNTPEDLIVLDVKGGATVYVPANSRALIPTGLILDIPQGYQVEIYPRSGLAFKNGINLANCVAKIDSDYVNELFILVLNNTNRIFAIKHGDRIAQGEMVPKRDTELVETKEKPGQKTDRVGGLGSTGV